MKIKIILAICCIFNAGFLSSQSSWTAKAKFPGQLSWKARASLSGGARGATCGFSLKGKGYVFGGFNGGTDYSELYEYNPVTNAWTKRASMPIAGMREPAAFTIDSVAYVGLGFRAGASSALSHMYKYSPATNSWTAVANFYQGRRAASGFSIDSLGYIIGGSPVGSLPDNSLYAYSPVTNTWTKKATMPGLGRSYPTSAVFGGLAYVMGGYANGSSAHLKDFYSYNPKTDKWDTLANFPGAARATASSIVMDSVIYFGCGYGGTTYYKDWYGYDTRTKSWFATASFTSTKTYGNAFFSIDGKGYISTGAFGSVLTDSTFEFSPGGSRGAACGFAVGNYGYVFGGTDMSSEFSDLYQFDPAANKWSKKASMPVVGMREPVAFTIDSIAYVGLGYRAGFSPFLSHMYRYSPAMNKWTTVASFPEDRRAAIGFSIDSLGYVFGGIKYGAQPDNSLYSYSPKTNKWTKKATMPGSGRSFASCGVVDGKAYCTGGYVPTGGSYIKELYMYDPVKDSWSKLTDFPGAARSSLSVIVIDKTVYFGAGLAGSAYLRDWYGYNTVSKVWDKILDIPTSKTYHNAYFSVGGKGYIATGGNNNVFLDSTLELTVLTNGVKRAKADPKMAISSIAGTGEIQVASLSLSGVKLELYDPSGKLICINTYKKHSQVLTVQLPQLSTGVYLLVATQDKERVTGRILYNKQ